MSKEVLSKSGIGLCVNRLRKRALASQDEGVQKVAERSQSLVQKWRHGFHAERDKEEANEEQAKKQPPLFLLGSKGRNRTCKVFYQRLIGGLSHAMERDEEALAVAKRLERLLLRRYGSATAEYSDHARTLLSHLSKHRDALRSGELSCTELLERAREHSFANKSHNTNTRESQTHSSGGVGEEESKCKEY